ncbi:MAG: hypothetical protein MUC43_11500 [Pirellula sp.]|nr:hypothetical protein [Pirellula sp.]
MLRGRGAVVFFGVISCVFFALAKTATAQTPWENDPYRVNVWMSVSSSVGWDEMAEEAAHREVLQRIDASFGGVFNSRVQSSPDSLYGSILYRIDELSVEQVIAREMTLVVGKSDEAKAKFLELNPPPPPRELTEEEKLAREKMSKQQIQEIEDAAARAASLNSVRTFESALERIGDFHVLALPYAGIQRDIAPFLQTPTWQKFKDKLRSHAGNIEQLKTDLDKGNIIAALVNKSEYELIKGVCRKIPARLPWQPEALLRDFDKIYLTSIDRSGEFYRVRVKELDSVVRRIGPMRTLLVARRQDIATAVEHLVRSLFNPIVRIEETDNSTAVLRVRAASLITSDQHPAFIGLGDVLIPHIRRDDSSGNPTLVQTLPFTYIVATEKVDATSLFYGAIFTARRGALTAAKNRRTIRVGVKVPPASGTSDIRLTFRQSFYSNVKQPNVGVTGAEIYLRTPGHDDLVMLGRTDWRGVSTLGETKLPTIKYDIPSKSTNPSIAQAREMVLEPVPPPAYPAPPEPEQPEATAAGDSAPAKVEKPPKGEIQANLPLYLYYVKNGDTLLARLPIITGHVPVEEAQLPDDRKRLEAEAFLKGVQNEVLDIVVQRKILEARVKTRIEKKDLVEAEKNLEDLKRLKSYEKLFSEVEAIQRRALATETGQPNPSLVTKVENLVKSTRDMIQMWLQTTTVNDLEKKLEEAR